MNIQITPLRSLKALTATSLVALSITTVSHGAVNIVVSEIDGGTKLKFHVTGYLDTNNPVLHSPNASTYNESAALINDNDIYVSGNPDLNVTVRLASGGVVFTGTPITFSYAQVDIVSWTGGSGIVFGANRLNARIITEDSYVSGSVVDYTLISEPASFASEGITVGDTATMSWGTGGAGNSITFTAVPEPSSSSLVGLSAVLLLLRRRKSIR